MSKQVLHTKWGKATFNGRYYNINPNGNKFSEQYLHRLIWEDFYDCKVPDGFVIHHKNEDKHDNCILNLQLMREIDHKRLHGFPYKENDVKYYRVSIQKSDRYKQGFRWRYRYYDEFGKQRTIWSIDIDKLKEKVLAKGLEWIEYD